MTSISLAANMLGSSRRWRIGTRARFKASPPPQVAQQHAPTSWQIHAAQVIAYLHGEAYVREPCCRCLTPSQTLSKPTELTASALAQEDMTIAFSNADLQGAGLEAQCLPREWFVHLSTSC
jgi:hypothetical protein